jgi:microcystin degradation protein MlrC
MTRFRVLRRIRLNANQYLSIVSTGFGSLAAQDCFWNAASSIDNARTPIPSWRFSGRARDWELVRRPEASPSPQPVTRDAFDALAGPIRQWRHSERITCTASVLGLHGAMVTTDFGEDGEGER